MFNLKMVKFNLKKDQPGSILKSTSHLISIKLFVNASVLILVSMNKIRFYFAEIII